MRLDLLAGNAGLKRQLSARGAGRGLHHAYLIAGPEGSGKRTLARLIAAAMVCSGGEPPCGACPHCKKALNGIHPDIISVDIPEGKREILVEQARQMRAGAIIRPNEAERKVYLIHAADTMNRAAQNAILKILEEGPAYAAFLLLACNPAALLPTIRSRCESLNLSPVPPEEALPVLAGRFPDKPQEELRRAVLESGGILGKALDRLSGNTGGEALQGARELLAAFASGDEAELMAFCSTLERKKADRDTLCALLEESGRLLRDALVFSAGASVQTGPDELPLLRRLASFPRKTLLEASDAAWKFRADAGLYVGRGNLCAALCARFGELLS